MRDSILFRCTVASFLAIAASVAHADCVRLVASNNPDLPNAFTLTFPPEYGGTRQANITYAEITLEACDGANPPTARFVDYYQEAESLLLPGDIPTGELTILVTDSQSVSYFPLMGEFSTSDFYAIYFTGDLSAYGITSPFYLPGASAGVISYHTPTSGAITMNWHGQAALPNPLDPQNPISFSYTCQVNTLFAIDPGCATNGCEAGDLDGDCSVGLADLSQLLANFGSSGAAVRPADGDVDRDLDVDLSDLTALLAQFGNDCN